MKATERIRVCLKEVASYGRVDFGSSPDAIAALADLAKVEAVLEAGKEVDATGRNADDLHAHHVALDKLRYAIDALEKE